NLIFLLKEAALYYTQDRKEDCLATCRDVCERASRLNSGNWPFLLTRAFYIISALYRQTKEFDLAKEYIEKSSECLELVVLSEETAVNRYNAAALLAEKSADVGITADEEINAQRLFEEVAGFWSQLKENESMMRYVIRSHNRMTTYFLKTSRTRFPDLGKEVSEVDIVKAGTAIQKVERNLLTQCPKRLEATFLIGKADYFIRRATRRGLGISEGDRKLDFQRAKDELDKAMRISRELMMHKEIEGIEDRTRTIQDLITRGLRWFDDPPPPEPAEGNEPGEGNTNDLEDLFQNLLISEDKSSQKLTLVSFLRVVSSAVVSSYLRDAYVSALASPAKLDLVDAEAAKVRSRIRWAEEGESSTSYFVRLEKKHGGESWFSALKDDDNVVSDLNGIMDAWSNVPKCEGLFEADEVFRDLNGMARGTKPGSDGLSVDFYITFWDTLGTDLVDVLNSSYRDGFLPSSSCKGLFNLTFKRGDRLDRKNWRPITLLSLEFKLCAPYRGCSSFASHSFCGPF
ncbi:uncharacterized protein LOC110054035, partial [Orbicella faveolata]|uniref:uncharacterized protein LOC110054035 n=1 Tax=Orbicella faveolata TaxID=48498 RepID=UPI0009E25C0D